MQAGDTTRPSLGKPSLGKRRENNAKQLLGGQEQPGKQGPEPHGALGQEAGSHGDHPRMCTGQKVVTGIVPQATPGPR